MTVLELGVFAGSPAAHARTRATLLPRLERLRAIWPQLTVRTRHYVAPADVLGFVVVAAESRPVPGRSQVVAGAAAPDPELAATIFCAELAERAASAWYGGGVGRRRGTADELVAEGGSVFDCAGYVGTPLASGPLGFATFDLRRTYEWVPAECLTTGSPVWIPLPLVAPSVPPAERFCEQTTIGCAAAGDVDLATARGLEELHERHILRVAWFLGRPFEPAPAPPAWAALADADARAGWTTRFYRAAIAPGLELAVLYGRHRAEPLYTIGSGCGRSWAEAAEHATRETVQGRLVAWLYRHGTPAPRAVRSYPDHLFWYSRPERIGCVDRFFDRLGAPGHAASPAADWFDDAELRGGAVRLRLLEETDINVVRVLSPALQPLEARHDGARLVGPWRRRHTAGSLRTVPHPFG
jgi:ribosomal protein S12 methylthiotransferase accessory factor YcaO